MEVTNETISSCVRRRHGAGRCCGGGGPASALGCAILQGAGLCAGLQLERVLSGRERRRLLGSLAYWEVAGGFNTSGGLVGGTIGYNYQMNQIVLGVEGDIDWADINGTVNNAACPLGCKTRDTWLSTVRGPLLGYAAIADAVHPAVSRWATSRRRPLLLPAAVRSMRAGRLAAGLNLPSPAIGRPRPQYLYVGSRQLQLRRWLLRHHRSRRRRLQGEHPSRGLELPVLIVTAIGKSKKEPRDESPGVFSWDDDKDARATRREGSITASLPLPQLDGAPSPNPATRQQIFFARFAPEFVQPGRDCSKRHARWDAGRVNTDRRTPSPLLQPTDRPNNLFVPTEPSGGRNVRGATAFPVPGTSPAEHGVSPVQPAGLVVS